MDRSVSRHARVARSIWYAKRAQHCCVLRTISRVEGSFPDSSTEARMSTQFYFHEWVSHLRRFVQGKGMDRRA
eukprot:scaffold86_cov338-Pavlova_lutheri.AAC.71